MKIRIAIALAAGAAGLSVWTVLASRMFVWMGGLSGYFPSPWITWWRYARQSRIDGSTLTYLIASGIIAALPIGLLAAAVTAAYRRRRRRRLVPARGGGVRPVEGGVTDNHGHAQFAESSLMAKHFAGPGCLIGAVDRGERAQLLFDNKNVGPGHCMVFGGPGSHKTTAAVTRIWNWRGPRVVFDPSSEIAPIMSEALQAKGCNVVTVGLTSSGINALDWIDIRHPESDAHIRSAVDWIYNEGATSGSGGDQGRDPFWGTWGRALVTCIMAYMLHHPSPHAPRTLASLRRGIATPENDMQDFLRGVHNTSSSRMARDLAGGLMGMKAEKTFSGIYANSFAATEWLSVGAYADAVSGDAMHTSDILDRNTVVFVQLPLRTLLATPAVGRAVMGALFNAMFHADGSGNTDRILFQIDEAWVLGAMKEIKLCHTTARKYRGAVSTIWQSEAQMEGVWGREGAKMMRDTVSWRSYNAVQDGDVAEKLSRDLGEHAVMAYSEGDNSGQSKSWSFASGSRSKGRNTNIHEIKRRLIKPDEITRAPADEMFVLARDFPHPIRCVSAPYFRYPEIARRMNANRFATV
jgi:type IV secretion system protein VirD4